MRSFISTIAVVAALAPGFAHAQTVTVQTDEVPPPPPAQPAQPQGQVQVQVGTPQPQPVPQPYVQPQPQPQPYYQPAPQPQREARTRTRPTLGLVIPGAIMFGVSWILHAALISPFGGYTGTGFQPDWATFRWTGVIPVLGPWIQMAVKPGSLEQDSWAGYLAVNGLLQAAGVTMFILGFVFQETETYYVEVEGDTRFAVMPTVNQDFAGLTAVGEF